MITPRMSVAITASSTDSRSIGLEPDLSARLLPLCDVLDHHELAERFVGRRLDERRRAEAPDDAAVLAQIAPLAVLRLQPGGLLLGADSTIVLALLMREEVLVAHCLQFVGAVAEEVRHALVGADDAAVRVHPDHRDAGKSKTARKRASRSASDAVLGLEARPPVGPRPLEAEQTSHVTTPSGKKIMVEGRTVARWLWQDGTVEPAHRIDQDGNDRAQNRERDADREQAADRRLHAEQTGGDAECRPGQSRHRGSGRRFRPPSARRKDAAIAAATIAAKGPPKKPAITSATLRKSGIICQLRSNDVAMRKMAITPIASPNIAPP